MARSRIIAIGASAGGFEPLLNLARTLPADFDTPICIVLHLAPQRSSALPTLFNRAKRIPAAYARHGEALAPRRIFIAPPDRHLVVKDGRVWLGLGPRENGSRPAIDPLFRSVASEYGGDAIGVVLSGALYDGTAGLIAIKAQGGTAVVQDPEEAMCASMPRSALNHVTADHVVASAELPALLQKLVAERPVARSRAPEAALSVALSHEVAVARDGVPDERPAAEKQGDPSAFSCPDCHGVLWEIKEGELIRFRCRVGHAYLPDALAQAQSGELEEALWTALRSLRESAALATRLAGIARQRSLKNIADAHEARALEAQERGRLIEAVLKKGELSATIRGTTDLEGGGGGEAERHEG